jgi:hypothetical protein
MGVDNTPTEITNPFEYPTDGNAITAKITIVNSTPAPVRTKKKRGIVVPKTRASVTEIKEFLAFARETAPRG